ncbi:tetratricopeptide repeat protein [Candidatus Woesearchaeota archaeon]|nr:tetratricopeptide repeat protein [Candidatus Woesearchaeota archaeon]MBT4647568.1 tetratricopeptide repeat protein [archaeon]MBT6821936.1 tetratricopeptide repeat protein [archaeon]
MKQNIISNFFFKKKRNYLILVSILLILLSLLLVYLFSKNTFFFNFNVIDIEEYENSLEEANILFSNSKYQESEKIYIKLIKLDSKKIDPYLNLFWTYYMTPYSDKNKSIEITEKCIKNTHERICKRLNMILMLQNDDLDKIDDSLITFEKNMDDLDYWSLIIYFDKIGNYDKFEEMVKNYLDSSSVYEKMIYDFRMWQFHDISNYLITNDKIDTAMFFFHQIIEKKDNFDEHYKIEAKQYLSRLYQKRADFKKAEDLLININNACSYQALGALYSKMNYTNKVIQSFIKSADIEPNRNDLQFEAAMLCFNYGVYGCAETYIDRAINISNISIYNEIKGYIFLGQNRIEEARDIFNELYKINSSLFPQVGLAHILIIEMDYDAAKLILKDSKMYLDILDLNEYELENKIFDIGEYFRLVKSMISLGFGWIYSNQGIYEESLQYFDQVLIFNSKNILGRVSKVNSLIWLNKLEEAEILLNETLELYPENQYVHEAVGLLHFNKGDYEEAEDSFKKVLDIEDKKYTCPYEGLGLIYYNQGDYSKSKKNLIKSIDINPDIEFKKYNTLAKIYIKEEKFNEARILLEKSIENYPYDDEAKNLLEDLNEKE